MKKLTNKKIIALVSVAALSISAMSALAANPENNNAKEFKSGDFIMKVDTESEQVTKEKERKDPFVSGDFTMQEMLPDEEEVAKEKERKEPLVSGDFTMQEMLPDDQESSSDVK